MATAPRELEPVTVPLFLPASAPAYTLCEPVEEVRAAVTDTPSRRTSFTSAPVPSTPNSPAYTLPLVAEELMNRLEIL